MRRPLDRRLARLERNSTLALPWHLPANEWTDAQLLALAIPGRIDTITDEELAEIAEGAVT
jgi:hypothetical protein